MPFLSAKGVTHAYLQKILITQNEIRIPFLHLFINCIPASSSRQILSKGKYYFLFMNFLITDLCNSLANSLFKVLSFLIPLEEFFNQKVNRALKKVHIDIHHISDF